MVACRGMERRGPRASCFLLLQNLASFNFTHEVHVFIYTPKKMLSEFSILKSNIQRDSMAKN